MRRAVVSVSSNIVEGNAGYSVKEQVHFIEIAVGSLMEVYCQLILLPKFGQYMLCKCWLIAQVWSIYTMLVTCRCNAPPLESQAP